MARPVRLRQLALVAAAAATTMPRTTRSSARRQLLSQASAATAAAASDSPYRDTRPRRKASSVQTPGEPSAKKPRGRPAKKSSESGEGPPPARSACPANAGAAIPSVVNAGAVIPPVGKLETKADDKTPPRDIVLGYACLNTALRAEGVYTSRTVRIATLKKLADPIAHLKDLAHQNLEDLQAILDWNAAHGVGLFRLNSGMFPLITHPDYAYTLEDFAATLRDLGELATRTGQRITMHPDQFNQLTSLREDVVERTIECLTHQCDILDMMGLGEASIMVIHGGSKQGGVDAALARFATNFARMPLRVQRRMVLENCEMCFSVEDLLPLCEKLGIPLVLDYHHHDINPGTTPLAELMPRILRTWHARGIRPKFHMSQSRPGVLPSDNATKRRAHSDLITRLPDPLPDGIDLMLECKLKEQSLDIVAALL